MKQDLLGEFSDTFIIAQDLYHRRILQKQSYLALNSFNFNNTRGDSKKKALINLLFEELIDPITYDNFKDYSRTKSNRLFTVLNSMG